MYDAAQCLLAASEAEGFGLPLIEAAQHGLPVMARDIPVFREVAGDHAFYFDGTDPEHLADAIRTGWTCTGKSAIPGPMPCPGSPGGKAATGSSSCSRSDAMFGYLRFILAFFRADIPM